MAYEGVKVAIEYDGEQHWTDSAVRQRDIDKGVAFQELGWHVIRVGNELLWRRRATYIHRVETALQARGFVWQLATRNLTSKPGPKRGRIPSREV